LKLPVFDYEHDEAYYRATVGDVKICGQLYVDRGYESVSIDLKNSQGFGENSDYDDEMGYTHLKVFEIDFPGEEYNGDKVAEEFAKAGITSFSITNDRRMIEAIDRTKFDRFDTQWSITINNSGEIEFGCGEVQLSLDEIREFIRVQRLLNESDTYNDTVMAIRGNISADEVDLDEAEELVKKAEVVIESRKQFQVKKAAKKKK